MIHWCTIVALSASLLSVSASHALERPASKAEVSVLETALRTDVRIHGTFSVRDVVVSLDFEAGAPQALVCGQVTPPADRPNTLRYQPVSLAIVKEGSHLVRASGRPEFGGAALDRCRQAGVRISEINDLPPQKAAGSQEPAARAASRVRAANNGDLAALRRAFNDSDLRDPGSVQMRRVRVGLIGKYWHACGQYNAKNAYGAYVGFKPFSALIADGQAHIISLGSTEAAALAVMQICSEKGITAG